MMQSPVEPRRSSGAARAHLERGYRFEQAGAIPRALAAYQDALAASTTPAEQAEARLRIARSLRSLSQWTEALEEARASVEIAVSVGADDLAAEALNVEVGIHQFHGSFADAEAVALRALALARGPRVRGITLQNRGRTAALQRDFDRANRYFAESIDAFREAGYELGMAIALTNAAATARDMGDAARSLELAREATSLCRRLNALDVLLTAVQNQAAALVMLGQFSEAEGLLTEALGHFTSARNLGRQAECLEILGEISEHRANDRETARRCYLRARDLAMAADDRVLVERLTQRLDAR